MIVDRHRENHLGPILTDDILVEEFANLAGSWIARTPQQVSFCELLAQGCGAKVDAFAANEDARPCDEVADFRSEEHTYELQSLMRISYAVFCLKKKTKTITNKKL